MFQESSAWRSSARLAALLGALLVALLVAACAGNASTGTAPTAAPKAATTPAAKTAPTTAPAAPTAAPAASGAQVEVSASEFKLEPKALTAKAGETTFVVKNAGTIEHNFVIEGTGGQSVGRIANIAVGKTEQLKVNLTPGSYVTVCTLPGHREAGMVGTLTVTQ